MSARASHSHLSRDAYWDDYASQELFAGEPILPRPRRRGTMLRAAFMLVLLGGCGYVALQTKDVWRPYLPADLAELKAWVASFQGPADQKATAEVPRPLPPQPLAARDVAEPPRVEAGMPVPNSPTATKTLNAAPDEPAADEAASNDPPEPLPPPVIDPADPYQKRALDAGLHPGLSRALLTRMSDTDYKNAAHAIKTALAKTPYGEVFVWPSKALPKDAIFEVKFVRSASADCRRYVVTIAMNRWATTAQPMEKCGLVAPVSKPAERHSQR